MTNNAVIFDLDGTLIDSIDDIADAMNHTLIANGFPEHTNESYKYFVGDGIHNLVDRVMPVNSSKEQIEKVKAEYVVYYSINNTKRTKVYCGVHELLCALNERLIPVAVLSNKSHKDTVLLTEKYFPDIKFVEVLGARQGIPIKPDPTSALSLATLIGATPENILYVGDTSTDMKTAQNANMTAIGVLWGFRTRDELLNSGAEFLLEKPNDLLGILDR